MCEPGTYSDSEGASECEQCDAGLYCPEFAMSVRTPCPAGYYCPLGSVNPIPCKVGTYNPTEATSGEDACIDCGLGKYCDEEGLTYEKGSCAAGYFCLAKAPSETPAVNLTESANSDFVDKYGICPRGHYCPTGTSTPQKCPIGYYLNAEGG